MCELCKAEPITKWFYEDETVWVALCRTCNVPMIVLRRHGEATERELGYMEGVAHVLFLQGKTGWIRKEQRKILDHAHWHLEGYWEFVG